MYAALHKNISQVQIQGYIFTKIQYFWKEIKFEFIAQTFLIMFFVFYYLLIPFSFQILFFCKIQDKKSLFADMTRVRLYMQVFAYKCYDKQRYSMHSPIWYA